MAKIPAELDETPRDDEPSPCGPNCPAGASLASLHRKIDRALRELEGDGSENRPGIRVRLDRVERALEPDVDIRIDRLEQRAAATRTWTQLTAGGLIAVAAERAMAWLSGRH